MTHLTNARGKHGALDRHEEAVNGWPVTDEEGRWLPNKEWPKTPTSGNWGRPSGESRLLYNGQAVIPEVLDRRGYSTLSERRGRGVGGSQNVKDVGRDVAGPTGAGQTSDATGDLRVSVL